MTNDSAPAPAERAHVDRHVLVAVAWPYANGSQHLGHLAGAYLPADVFARYHRIAGSQVLMVSGSDAHGTPITVRADQEGVAPSEIVERYHAEFLRTWDELGISFDLFTSTMTANHHDVTREMFQALRDNDYLEIRTTEQFYDPAVERFLPDRYVEGTCPSCGATDARGDQCDSCGRTLDPSDLLSPRSKLSDATPEPRPTDHWFILLSKLQDDVATWLESRQGWRPHVINWAKGFVKGGLHDRAITRDLAWGVELPEDAGLDNPQDKRIYVWFDAVIGYLSASKEWAARSGDPDAWKAWWQDPSAESYYFIGKDNVPFHAVYWPAQLMGAGDLNLPTNVPANQFVTFKGEKASKSKGIGGALLDELERFQPDTLRYAMATNLPEHGDTDLSFEELARRINEELVAAWGNLVNRVLAMTGKNFDGVVPQPGSLEDRDTALLTEVDDRLAAAGRLLEAVELRRALKEALAGAQAANAYLNATEPWKTAKTDRDRTATTLYVALQAIAGLNVAFAPFVPFGASTLDTWLGGDGQLEGRGWARGQVPAGTQLGDPTPLFRKVEIEPDAS